MKVTYTKSFQWLIVNRIPFGLGGYEPLLAARVKAGKIVGFTITPRARASDMPSETSPRE